MNKGATVSERQRLKVHWLLLIVHCSAGCHRNIVLKLMLLATNFHVLVRQKRFPREKKNGSENAHVSTFACAGFSITKLQLLRIYSHTCWDYCAVSMHTTCATTNTHKLPKMPH